MKKGKSGGNSGPPDASHDPDYQPPPESSTAILAKLSAIEREIVKVKFKFPRMNQAEIGKMLGLTRQAINKHFSNDELNAILMVLERDVFERIDHLREQALSKWETMLANKATPDWIQHSICRELLGPVLQSKTTLPAPAEIKKIIFDDESRPDVPGESV